ncbi:MAG: TatD family hydrolase [Alistipes sp.]|nr:TatD family hydrolase [Alistipes sp.]
MKVNIHTHHRKSGERTISTLGIHPYDAEGVTTDSIFAIERTALEYDAIGEIGLDYSTNINKEAQILLFKAQLEVARHLNKGVVIHCVKAFEEVMNILSRYNLPFVIFHGFIGSPEQALRAAARGYYLSFGHRTFRSPKSIEALKVTPANLLFFETDDSTINIEQIYGQASEVLGIPVPMLECVTNENFERITNL